MANYPTSLDTFPNPTATTKEDAATFYHDVGHSDLGDAVEGLEAKVGVDSSTVTSSLDYRMRNLEYPSATGGEDDDFNDGSFTGWTAVEAVTLAVTESRGRCSVVMPQGGASSNFHARVKAHTFATNDWCEASFRHIGRPQNYMMVGLVMSNGTAHGTSNAIHWLYYPTLGNAFRRQANAGFTADTSAADYSFSTGAGFGEVYLRWRYEGANTFRGYVSNDGISWIDVTGAYSGYTLTPTHWGFSMGYATPTYPQMMSLAYFRTGNG